MKVKTIRWLVILVLVSIPVLVITATGSAISGASLAIFNAHVDGPDQDICRNSDTDCHLYAAPETVWLNGGPSANFFGDDGVYFFAVLEPGGQPNPNDLGGVQDKNLSDDYDCYQNRVFNVKNRELSAYTGNIDCSYAGYEGYNLVEHWMDSGRNEPGLGNQKPNGLPPYLRLFPFSASVNSDGVYLLAICSLDEGYPVNPRECKYDAFKLQPGEPSQNSFFLDGYVVEDLYIDGYGEEDPGLGGWQIHISGIGPDGLPVEADVTTDGSGYWSYQSPEFVYKENEKPREVNLMVCETVQPGWTQSFPDGAGCQEISFKPVGFNRTLGVNFANWLPVSLTACNIQGEEKVPVGGWEVALTQEGSLISSQTTGADGCFTWQGLKPGSSYDLHAESIAGWQTSGSSDRAFLSKEAKSGASLQYTFIHLPLQGCPADFWQGAGEVASLNGQWLWDSPQDPDWIGVNKQPFIHDTNFCEFFGGCIGEKSMYSFIQMQAGELAGWDAQSSFNAAARSLVAAYLNASWGMNYAYSTTQLEAKWAAAVSNREDLQKFTAELDAANIAYQRLAGGPDCPISASSN